MGMIDWDKSGEGWRGEKEGKEKGRDGRGEGGEGGGMRPKMELRENAG